MKLQVSTNYVVILKQFVHTKPTIKLQDCIFDQEWDLSVLKTIIYK